MNQTPNYSVFYHGKLLPGTAIYTAVEQFASTFKVTKKRAEYILQSPRLLKKGLDHKIAYAYKKKLNSIGLVISLRPENNMEFSNANELSLEPIEKQNAPSKTTSLDDTVNPSAHEVRCAKCETAQAYTEFCMHCGVSFKKVPPNESTLKNNRPLPFSKLPLHASPQTSSFQTSFSNNVDVAQDSSQWNSNVSQLSLMSMSAAMIAGLVGALTWYTVAFQFEYETGLLAWAIGGLVGYASAKFGSNGQVAGVVCGVIALLSVLGGKYLFMSSVQVDFINELQTSDAEYTQEYEQDYLQEMQVALDYQANVVDDLSLKQFMIDHHYSKANDAESVHSDTLDNFRTFDEPYIKQLAQQSPSYQEWVSMRFEHNASDFLIFGLIMGTFGIVDILFLFFAVGTAFKIGSGRYSHAK